MGRRAVAEADAVAARAATDPDALAFQVAGGESLTFGDWDIRADGVAGWLVARGVGRGDRVGICVPPAGWPTFAAAYTGVARAGAAAVLLSPGAGPSELARALTDAGAVGVLGGPGIVAAAGPWWMADAGEVARNGGAASVDAPGGVDVVYPVAPLSPGRAISTGGAAVDVPAFGDGWLVHAWAPGTVGGQLVLGLVQAGPHCRAATLPVFDPARLCALVARTRAVACGLTPALAAAVVASGEPARHEVRSVARVLLTGRPSPALRAGVRAAFPVAALVEVGEVQASGVVAAPVAVSQEGMLWHEQFAPGSFNVPCLVRRYRGRLDAAALEWSLAELVRRHQPLRTTFAVVSGQLAQVVGDPVARPLTVVDLAGLAPAARHAEVARLVADGSRRPFDLARGPLFEPRLVRLGPDDHVLVVRLHHTVFDDWSVDVFRRELSALYTARLAGAPSPLLEMPVGFVDAARRQQARATAMAGGERAWWRAELAGAPLAVQAPLGHPGDDGPVAPLRRDLPAPLVAALRSRAAELRATPFMTLLAAFSVVLGRVTGQDDLLIATVVAHRPATDVEPLIGCFTKKVPLRLRVGGDPTFADLVARTRSSLLGALSHQDLSFDAAVQEGIGAAAARHGVVPQVAVVFQGEASRQAPLTLPGLVTEPYELGGEARGERHFSASDGSGPVWGDGIYLGSFLILSVLETADGMALVARGVFDRAEASRVLAGYEAVLADAVARPSSPVSTLVAGEVRPLPVPEDEVDVRGIRACRSRIEAALTRCPGVAAATVSVRDDAAGEAQLVVQIVPDGAEPPPTLGDLRRALWAELPGVVWPAAMVVAGSGGDGVEGPVGPLATVLAAMWGELRGGPADVDRSYWQDFSFLQVLAEAREAGIALADEDVVRARTPATLAAAHACRPRP